MLRNISALHMHQHSGSGMSHEPPTPRVLQKHPWMLFCSGAPGETAELLAQGRVKPLPPRPCHLHRRKGTMSPHVTSPPASCFASCKMPVKWENIPWQSRGLGSAAGSCWVSRPGSIWGYQPHHGGAHVARQQGEVHCSLLELGGGTSRRCLLGTFLS